MESRRVFLASAGALALSGCIPRPCPPIGLPSWSPGTALIDGHCHLFNVKDLSAARFLSWVIFKHYPDLAEIEKPPELKALDARRPEDPDWIDRAMEALLALVGAGSAPSATTELAVLEGRPIVVPRRGESVRPKDLATDRDEILDRAADLLGKAAPTPGEGYLREMILEAAGRAPAEAKSLVPLSRAERRAIAERAFSPDRGKAGSAALMGIQDFYLPGLLAFVRELKRFRHCIVDDLAELHRHDGQDPTLLVPAMVDFGRWLRDDPADGSTFRQQAAVWPAISRRKGGPAVHGYVAFCPLRQVLHDLGRFGPGKIDTACRDNPLEVVEMALKTQGFLGVKVYPPMGFRAATNALRGVDEHPMPMKVLADVFGRTPNDAEKDAWIKDLGGKLDAALWRLYDLCAREGAPVMAHGGNSIDAACRTGELADPYYWKPVLDRGGPPVMLGHFGGFNYRSADPGVTKSLAVLRQRCDKPKDEAVAFEDTWEFWLASYIDRHPDKPVYADMSMFTEALAAGTEAEAVKNFTRLNAQFPRMKDRLVFGTDWTMLAQKKGAEVYSGKVRAFVVKIFGAGYEDRIMRTNFLRYASLSAGSPTFERLARVYNGDPMLIERLTRACTA